MRDDFLTADWAGQHGQTSATIHTALARLAAGLSRLQARNYDAPWRHDVTSKAPRRLQCDA